MTVHVDNSFDEERDRRRDRARKEDNRLDIEVLVAMAIFFTSLSFLLFVLPILL